MKVYMLHADNDFALRMLVINCNGVFEQQFVEERAEIFGANDDSEPGVFQDEGSDTIEHVILL